MFLADGERPQRNWDGGAFDPSDALRDGLRSIARGAGPRDAIGNLTANLEQNCGITMLATDKPEPHTVAMTADASQLYRSEYEKIDERGRHARSDAHASVTNRIAENAAKLALIRAVSRNAADPRIEARDVAWGYALANHCAQTLLREADANIANSEFQAQQNKVLSIIRTNGVVSAGDFHRFGFRVPPRDRDAVLHSLVDAGLIAELPAEQSGAGRPPKRYTLN